MGIETLIGAATTLFSSFMSKPSASPSAPAKESRPDETSEGIADARRKRRSLASRTGRTGLRTPGLDETGQTRAGLTIQT